LLQPTNPFRENGFIDQAIEKFTASKADSLVSVLSIPHEFNPHWAFEENENGLLQIATGEERIIPRRQDLPKAYFRDGSIYITKTSVIKKDSLYGNSIAYIHSNPEWHVNIDTMEDWEKAETLLKNKTQS
jgi:CMP-N,N'-diacetyllegionaminic acid synthase